jgi:Rrf2 family protein
LNLNKSTRYALHAALEMALAADQPVTTAEVAERYAIPENVLAKVMQQMTRVGLVRGARGVGGGYRLARAAGEVSVQDIIDVFEPSPPADSCMLREEWGAACPGEREPACRLRSLFHEVDETVRATLGSVSLATLAGGALR